MRNYLFNLFLIAAILNFIVACDRPECKNTNPVFDQFTPDETEYKTELIKQISLSSIPDLRYWFDVAYDRDEKYYILIYIQGDGLCAKGEIYVPDRRKIKGLRNKGGYHGA